MPSIHCSRMREQFRYILRKNSSRYVSCNNTDKYSVKHTIQLQHHARTWFRSLWMAIRCFCLSEVDAKHDRDPVRPHRNLPYLTIMYVLYCYQLFFLSTVPGFTTLPKAYGTAWLNRAASYRCKTTPVSVNVRSCNTD